MNRTTKLLLAGLTAALLSACGSNVKLEDTQQTAAPVESRTTNGQAGGADASGAGSRGVQQVTLGDKDPLNDPASPLARRSIYFDFDSFAIRDEYRGTIDAHARYLTSNQGRRVLIQGNTDERGSREYNLALGQKRAEAVRRALGALGVPESQMEAVSLGEERPRATGSDEASWTENRRADLVYQ
ncbi:peptidoglycan-associated lipoprotein Pal [Zeimonas arvi]|uniref:Peptidoglycan-associated lipoprotein n=1 Tax=Zeimonas arvi TaxID=2498847 RepID=A0A5C8P5C4_9BURK|nr:peptidoglycan-associated lipoprotein Pal [Zeimonas arvi]TXL68513.1 peptidoglycan-associated lipoprotein Pal [Zeimonas arvi]